MAECCSGRLSVCCGIQEYKLKRGGRWALPGGDLWVMVPGVAGHRAGKGPLEPALGPSIGGVGEEQEFLAACFAPPGPEGKEVWPCLSASLSRSSLGLLAAVGDLISEILQINIDGPGRGTQSVIKARLVSIPRSAGPQGLPRGAPQPQPSCKPWADCWAKAAWDRALVGSWWRGTCTFPSGSAMAVSAGWGLPGLQGLRPGIAQPGQAVHFWLGCRGWGLRGALWPCL